MSWCAHAPYNICRSLTLTHTLKHLNQFSLTGAAGGGEAAAAAAPLLIPIHTHTSATYSRSHLRSQACINY